MICTIPGCEKPSKSRTSAGPCTMHLTRIRRHGDPETKLPHAKPLPIQEYLDRHVPIRPVGACWVWGGTLDDSGYGVMTAARADGKRKPSRAHRVIYEHLIGPIPAGKLLMHSCDNPPCVNPEHLTPGTDAENLGDMARKGRSARGSKHWSAKVTEAQVMEARRKYASGRYTLATLAAEYGLTVTPVSQLIRGVTWKHLPLVDKNAA